MNTKNVVTSLVISVIVVFLGFGIWGGNKIETKTIDRIIGADAGPDHYGLQQFFGGFLRGNTYSTTTGTATTIKQADLIGYDTIRVTPIVASATWTFMASSSATNLVPKLGNLQETCIINATTTSGINLIFAAGTGIDLKVASSSSQIGGAFDLTLAPSQMGCFKFVRGGGSTVTQDIIAALVEYNNAD